MKPITRSSLIDLAIELSWEKEGIAHKEKFFAHKLNCWRDIFPDSALERILASPPGERVTFQAHRGELVPAYKKDKIITMPWSRINTTALPSQRLQSGRFYPKGILRGVPGVFSADMTPFRCIAVNGHGITADLNHPLADIPVTVTLEIENQFSKSSERGGSCNDWIEMAFSGPGMQADPNEGRRTDFFSGSPFHRRDSAPDTRFYETDRFVHHIDDRSRLNLARFYGSMLSPENCVLDLMAGWESHIPETLNLKHLHGIGLNRNELRNNSQLSAYTLQDLNRDPVLSFNSSTFDAAVCSLSVEYLINPVSVFREVARVLKPGGIFAVTFSNRWFPEKAILIWEELHEFERMGLVMNCFIESGKFDSMATFSSRGYPRPEDDKYFPKLKFSDPLYAVTAKKAA